MILGQYISLILKLDGSLNELVKLVEGVTGRISSLVQLAKYYPFFNARTSLLNIKDGIQDLLKHHVRPFKPADRAKAVAGIYEEIGKLWYVGFFNQASD